MIIDTDEIKNTIESQILEIQECYDGCDISKEDLELELKPFKDDLSNLNRLIAFYPNKEYDFSFLPKFNNIRELLRESVSDVSWFSLVDNSIHCNNEYDVENALVNLFIIVQNKLDAKNRNK